MRTLLAFFLALATVGGAVLLTGSLPVLEAPEPPAGGAPPPLAPASYVTFTGIVTDIDGTPLEWAAVTVDGVTAFTDVDGRFELSPVLADAAATVEANGYRAATATARDEPAAVALQPAASAVLVVTLEVLADVAAYDAVGFARVASTDRNRLLPDQGGYSARLDLPAGDYVVVARTGDTVATKLVALPRRGTTVDIPLVAPSDNGGIAAASGVVVSTSGRNVDATSGLAWVVAETPGGRRVLVAVSGDGRFNLNLVAGSTLQAFLYDAVAGTIATSARVPAGRDLRLALGARSRLAFPLATTAQRQPVDTCGYRGLAVLAGRAAPLLEREALQRGVETAGGDLGLAEVTLGHATLLTMFDTRNGRVLARAWSGDAYEPAALGPLFDGGLRAAAQTRRPERARLVIRTDPLGARFLSVVDVRSASGDSVPDGTPIDVGVDAGTLAGATVARLLTAGGKSPEVRWDPPEGGVAPGTDVTFTARHTCGGTLTMRTLAASLPGRLDFTTSFAAPTSSQTCATGVAFDAVLTVEFARDEEGGVAVKVPITDGPRLAGWYDPASGAITAKGDADGVYWRIDGTIDRSRISGTLTVTFTGSECNRTDKYAFSGEAA